MLPFLRTKTMIPPISPRHIQRPRLLERVAEGTSRDLTLIVAPAGFGKTTLTAAWARSAQMPVAWLSLQPTDRSRDRFLAYLIYALQTISPQLGQTTLALMQAGSLEGALVALINDLAEIEGNFALILDDYHHVESRETAEILQFLLDNRPANFHLVIISRAEPGINLTRLHAHDQVIEIYTADLRFTKPEIHAFLESMVKLDLAGEDLTHLCQSTEGWAVGLQLTALAIARQPANWQSFAGQERIFDYLAQEVLRREPIEVQDFLIKSAMFDRFSVPFCDAVLLTEQHADGQSTAQPRTASDLLNYIERANLFLVHLDSTATWFRYHALFTDFLRSQLSAGQVTALYLSASDWFEQHGQLDDAIHYTVHAADFERAAVLLERHYIDMLQRGEQSLLLEWIMSLPSELLEKHNRLWLARGWASMISFDSIQAGECVQNAEAHFPSGSAGDRLRGEANALRILIRVFTGKTAGADEISSALQLVAEQDDFLHSLLHFNLGLHHVMSGETAQAVDEFNETMRLTQLLNNPLVSIVAQVQLGETRQIRGALGLAERTFQQAIAYAKETLGEHTFLLGMPFISWGDLLREQNRLDDAIRYIEEGIALCQMWQPMASMDGQIALARILAAQRDWNEAFNSLDRALQVAETSTSVLDDTFVVMHLVRLALLNDDLPRAANYIKSFQLENTGSEMVYHFWELNRLVYYRAKIVEYAGDLSGLMAVIDSITALITEAEHRERVTPVIEALILQSYAYHAAAKHMDAAENLTRALTLGAQSGYLRIFADEGKRLLHLLDQYRAQIHAPRSYFESVFRVLRSESNRSIPIATAPLIFEGMTPLTRRELDILTLLAAGKSNQEIAEERVLTLNTVKKHVANILAKLEVANRTQAVMLARKKGWVD